MKSLWLVESFDSLSLENLNAKAAMLDRLDNKYIIHQEVLKEALPKLIKLFEVLEIEGNRHFGYKTVYFDSKDFDSYYDHHQGRRQRCKIRVRKYLDTQACFLEVKLKDKRGATIKKRMAYNPENMKVLNAKAYTFIQHAYSERYGREFSLPLNPVLEIHYQRITLVAKEGGERMTIDSHLRFNSNQQLHYYLVDDALFIIETKSDKGNGIADKVLRQLHQHPIQRCSKYCVGMATLQEVKKHNKFMPALKKLNILSSLQSRVDQNFINAA